jgi:exopolysaccharide production protein ExoQ
VGWVFLGWTTLSCLWAIDTEAAFSAWLSLAQLFAITVLIASLVAVSPSIVRNAVWSYAISATATAVVGSAEYLQSPVIFLTRAAAFPDQDPAMFASLLLPAAIFLMWELQSRTSGVAVRLAAAFALVICVVALALSGTRSAWAGVIVAIVVWLVLRRESRQVIAVATLASGVAILVALVPGVGDFLFGRAASSLATGGAGRTDIWVVGLSIFAAAPLIGVGFGNFPVAFSPYAIAQAPAEAAVQGALYAGRAPHNVLLGTAVESGLVGGILLVAFLASALRQHASDGITNVVRVALISLFVQSMFLDILLQKQLWLFLGIAFGLAAAQRADLAVAPEPMPLPTATMESPVVE